MKDAGSLACPHCGAAAALDSVSCPYCKGALQTVACPSCFGMIFFGSKFCPRCGARAASPIVKPEEADCPRCKTAMTLHSLGGETLNQCDQCGGIWLDDATFKEICDDRDKQAAFVPKGKESEVKRLDPTQKPLVYIPCPRCREFMNRVNFAGRSGILLNVCAHHGTWFDKDELTEVVEFIRAGGLELARRDEIEKLKQQRHEIAYKLALSQQTNVLSTQLNPHPEQVAAGLMLRLVLGGG